MARATRHAASEFAAGILLIGSQRVFLIALCLTGVGRLSAARNHQGPFEADFHRRLKIDCVVGVEFENAIN